MLEASALGPLTAGLADSWGAAAVFIHGVDQQLLSWVRALDPFAAAFVAALALVAAVIGARRPMVRVVAAVVGLLLGFGYLARFGPWLHFLHLPVRELAWWVGAAFSIVGAVLPEAVTFLLGGLLGGVLLGSLVSPEVWLFAVVPGFLLGGGLGVVAFPLVAAVVASFGGGLVCAAALAALLPRQALGGYLLNHPLTTAGLGLAIGLAGFLGQLQRGEGARGAAPAGPRRKKAAAPS